MLGLTNATSEWIFTHPDRISVTISGADRLIDDDREALATMIWAEVAQALGITHPMPSWQIVKEKRATFAATPQQDARPPRAPAGAICFWRATGCKMVCPRRSRAQSALASAARLVLGQPVTYGKGR
jgi:hypothetical protein